LNFTIITHLRITAIYQKPHSILEKAEKHKIQKPQKDKMLFPKTAIILQIENLRKYYNL